MNYALVYLWLALLKRRTLHLCRGLRRPTTLIGCLAMLSLVGVIFHFRHEEFYGTLVRRENLIGLALVMLCGSLFKGFLQRGLTFEPPDIDFLFTSPFTQRQIVVYRLLANYVYAVVQGLVFLAIFASHLSRPLLVTGCLILLQIACFHVAATAAIWAGAISQTAHHRIRWMMLGCFFVISALYLRLAWEIRIVPGFMSSPLAQLLFYPAVTLPDVTAAPGLHYWGLSLLRANCSAMDWLWGPVLSVAGFAAGALGSFWLLLRLRANVFEAALTTTTRVAERQLRVRQGRCLVPVGKTHCPSFALPSVGLFRGVGALVWKNLVVARRSRHELLTAAVFVLIYTGSLGALVWKLHEASAKAGPIPGREALGFCAGVTLFIAMLGFFLQRMFPFDFRRDGEHLVGFRTLPVSPGALVLAEIAVPCGLVLVCQAIGLAPLALYGFLSWPMLLFLPLAFPAVALALNGVWNLHYLLAATRRAGSQAQSPSAVGTLLVVALSFLVFWPAGWTALSIGRRLNDDFGIAVAAATGLAVQIIVDVLILLLLAKLFQRFEVARDA